MQRELKKFMKVVNLISKPFIKIYAQPLKNFVQQKYISFQDFKVYKNVQHII